jgi:hypothetical protein
MTATSLSITDILTHLVVTFLTPMFFATTGGDFDQARAAALATVRPAPSATRWTCCWSGR